MLADEADLQPRPASALHGRGAVRRGAARRAGERRRCDPLDPPSRALPHRRGRAASAWPIPSRPGRSLTDVAVAALEGALRVARSAVDPEGSVDFAVIGMGRFGGQELGFASDIDVMFVYEPRPGVDDEAALRAAAAIAEELRRLLMAPERRSAAGHRRRPAARGQAGTARALAGLVRGLLRAMVVHLGGAGAAARGLGGRRRGARGRLPRRSSTPALDRAASPTTT